MIDHSTEAHPRPPIRRKVVDTPLGQVTLASDEEFVDIQPSVIHPPEQRTTPISILLQMAGVGEAGDLGSRGPVIASTVNEENAQNAEVRRYEAKFGRDAFYTADFLQDVFPSLESGTVRYFAGYQARSYDERAQAEPGKVPNHVRHPDDPLARRLTQETGRRWPWFGGTDTTVQFILAACRTLIRNPELGSEPVIFPEDHPSAGTAAVHRGKTVTLDRSVAEATEWLLRHLRKPAAHSLLWAGLNRKDSFTVWTDSPNAFYHRNGALPPPRVAPVSLQAQVYDALLAVAELRERTARSRRLAEALKRRASELKASVLHHFVVEDDRGLFLANAVDVAYARPRPLAVRAVDMGFTLDSALLSASSDKRLVAALVDHLMGPKMLTPMGITGKAMDEVRFEKFDYHSQIWAFAVYKVARGARRHALPDVALDLEQAVLRQTADGMLPENVGAGTSLEYCPHVLTIRRRAANGRQTLTVKERTPAPFAAWTAGAVIAIEALRCEGGSAGDVPEPFSASI